MVIAENSSNVDIVDFFSFHVHFVFAPFVSKLFENMNGNVSKIKDEK
jgi:hypothetical protein